PLSGSVERRSSLTGTPRHPGGQGAGRDGAFGRGVRAEGRPRVRRRTRRLGPGARGAPRRPGSGADGTGQDVGWTRRTCRPRLDARGLDVLVRCPGPAVATGRALAGMPLSRPVTGWEMRVRSGVVAEAAETRDDAGRRGIAVKSAGLSSTRCPRGAGRAGPVSGLNTDSGRGPALERGSRSLHKDVLRGGSMPVPP